MSTRPSVPAPWLPLAEQTVRELEALGVRFDACKEKFGELVIYVQPNLGPELQAQVDSIIAAAAAAAQGVCSVCGAATTTRSGFYRVCDQHAGHYALQGWPRPNEERQC